MRTIERGRFERGMAIWKAGQVSPNGVKGQYFVASQSGNGRYLVATSWAAFGARCNCPDFGRGHTCKHVWAASLAEAATRIGRKLETGKHLDAIAGDLLVMAISGIPASLETKWQALWTVCETMDGEAL